MYKIDTDDAVASLPAVPGAGSPGYFSDGDPLHQIDGTTVPSWWLNMIMMEMVNVVLAGGLTLNKASFTQLRDAIASMISDAVAGIGDGGVPTSREIDTAGLATGGGDLSANRTITVPAASDAEAIDGSITNKAVVPHGLAAAIAAGLAALGYPYTPDPFTDCNDVIKSGFYRVENTASNRPPGASEGQLICCSHSSGGDAVQIYGAVSGADLFVRFRTEGNVWSSWLQASLS